MRDQTIASKIIEAMYSTNYNRIRKLQRDIYDYCDLSVGSFMFCDINNYALRLNTLIIHLGLPNDRIEFYLNEFTPTGTSFNIDLPDEIQAEIDFFQNKMVDNYGICRENHFNS